MKIGSLFSGIGGLELGLEMAGLGPVLWQVEKDQYCQQVLEKHWPRVKRIKNVEEAGKHNLEPVDLICGGFPCQDISSAGKGGGLSGQRSGLWSEFARIVKELRPRWAVVENVGSSSSRWVDPVRVQLERLEYETLPIPMSAQDVGAPHLRSRVFIIAHTERVSLRNEPERRPAGWAQGLQAEGEAFALDTSKERRTPGASGWTTSPAICRVDDGFPERLDRNKALGNAVVPQCAEVVGHIIQELRNL